MLNDKFPGAFFTLKLEKPRAISFCDAPSIKVSRRVPGIRSTPQRNTHLTTEAAAAVLTPDESEALTVIKPYA
jgi:hypothetical protein